jgi:hypothetical protein
VTVRTFLLAVGCAVAVVVLMAAAPKPRVTAIGVAFTIAPDSTVTATAGVRIRGTLQPGDQIRFKFTKDGVVVANQLVSELSLTQTLPAPGYGQTSSYNACARVVYPSGTQSAEVCGTTPWVYARPGLPPAEVESVELLPASLSLSAGQSATFTATVRGSF